MNTPVSIQPPIKRTLSAAPRRCIFAAVSALIASSLGAMAIADTWYVDAASPCEGNGSQASPYCRIQLAIDAAAPGDEIVVAPGIYNEGIDFLGKAITLRSSHGPAVTIIDGSGLNDSVVKCINGELQDTILMGFTIQNGSAPAGGGMFNDASSPTIQNCVFNGNTAVGRGGGMANLNGSNPTVTNSWFRDNVANAGGGMFNFSSSPTIVNSVFSDNHGIAISGALDNSSASNPKVLNCTFSRNSTNGVGGGMTTGSGANSSLVVVNCVFWQNQDIGGMDESAQIHVGAGLPTARFNCIQGLVAGGIFDSGSNTNNIDADPRFIDPIGGDFRLSSQSPCIDAGDTRVWDTAYPVDIDGEMRVVNRPQNPDTGVPVIGHVVDMGAYERQVPHPCDTNDDLRIDALDIEPFLWCLFP